MLCFPLKRAVFIFVFKLGTAFAFSACSGIRHCFGIPLSTSHRDKDMGSLEQFHSGEIAHERSPPAVVFGVS